MICARLAEMPVFGLIKLNIVFGNGGQARYSNTFMRFFLMRTLMKTSQS